MADTVEIVPEGGRHPVPKRVNAGPQTQPDTIDQTSPDFDIMKDDGSWELINSLMGGTKAMRKKGEKYLPRERKEKMRDWENRRDRSFLLNKFKDAVNKTSSKPFSRPITLQNAEKLHEQLKLIEDDADGTGRNLTQFFWACFKNALEKGLTHVLVDFPAIDGQLTLAQERALGVRPRFVHIKAEDLFFWKFDNDDNLVEIRFTEKGVESSGEHSQKKVERIRVYKKETWELWEKNEKGAWEKKEDGTHTFNGVPLTTWYMDQDGVMTATPPFLELAWTNLTHWQSYSDQRNLLRVARVPIVVGSGFTKGEIDDGIEIGATRFIVSENPDAKIEHAEHSGKAIEAGRMDLKDLEEQMDMMALEPFVGKTGAPTATAKAIDESKSQSSVQAWIRSGENVVKNCYALAGEWVKYELPDDFKADIFNDFAIVLMGKDDKETLLKTVQSGKISQQTYLRECKRRGFLSENLDVEEEIEAIESQPPLLMGIPESSESDEGGEGDEE